MIPPKKQRALRLVTLNYNSRKIHAFKTPCGISSTTRANAMDFTVSCDGAAVRNVELIAL